MRAKGGNIGQVILIFLIGAAGVMVIGLGFIFLKNPSRMAAAFSPIEATANIFATAPKPSNTPFQPLPTITPSTTPSRLPATEAVLPSTPLPPTSEPQSTQAAWPPLKANIENIVGYSQSYALSCESRSAVDWAHFFGVEISETDFLFRLPLSDNPEKGFVGYYNDYGGQVPPYSYGVHADPVAALLQDYGLPADARKGLSLDELRSEIASGRPVIVWVIYGVSNGYALDYTASDGQSMVVAPNEHTVIVIGYDESSFTVLDGAWVYSRSIEQFHRSWEVLGNMAVIYQP